MKIKVQEIKDWFKSLDENKYGRRAYFNIDAKRVAHFVNNGIKSTLPSSMSRKNPQHEYALEKRLATTYLENVMKVENTPDNIINEAAANTIVISDHKGKLFIIPEGNIPIKNLSKFKKDINGFFKEDGHKVKFEPIEMDSTMVTNPNDEIDYMTLIALVVHLKRTYGSIKRVNKNKYKVII